MLREQVVWTAWREITVILNLPFAKNAAPLALVTSANRRGRRTRVFTAGRGFLPTLFSIYAVHVASDNTVLAARMLAYLVMQRKGLSVQ